MFQEHDLKGERLRAISEWCHINHWTMLETTAVYGMEDQCVVVFEAGANLEMVSRARNALIFVTTKPR